jgi:hypothetical protein
MNITMRINNQVMKFQVRRTNMEHVRLITTVHTNENSFNDPFIWGKIYWMIIKHLELYFSICKY